MRTEKITVKIASFSHGSLASLVNTQQDLASRTPGKIQQLEWDEIAQNIPDECLSKFEYGYDDLVRLLANEGYNGRKERMFPSDILGLAELTLNQIKEFKNYNLVILGVKNKIY